MSDFITFVLASYACRLLVAKWYETKEVINIFLFTTSLYETRGIVDTLDTCAVSRYFYCYDIPRYFGDTGIVT